MISKKGHILLNIDVYKYLNVMLCILCCTNPSVNQHYVGASDQMCIESGPFYMGSFQLIGNVFMHQIHWVSFQLSN